MFVAKEGANMDENLMMSDVAYELYMQDEEALQALREDSVDA